MALSEDQEYFFHEVTHALVLLSDKGAIYADCCIEYAESWLANDKLH